MIQFKDFTDADGKPKSLKVQWDDAKLRPELRLIVLAANGYAELAFGRSLVVSSIYRTPEENAALNSKSTTHCDWRAVDCSMHGFNAMWHRTTDEEWTLNWTPDEFHAIRDFIHGIIKTGAAFKDGTPMPVVYDENHGTGPHLHFQTANAKPVFVWR